MAIRDIDLDGQRSHERVLIDRFAQSKDPDAFSALVTSTRPWLVSTCTRILGGDRYTAEDVAQECYVKAFGFLAQGGSPIDFRSWLFSVARNACIDEIRKTHAVPVDEVPERAVADDEFGLDPPLETAWTSLEPRQRTLIFMREFMGMSYREIAEHTDTSLPAVETALFRARSSLKRGYRRAGGTIPGLAWLGFGLRRLLGGHPRRGMSAPARWAASIHDRVNSVLARIPGSSPGDVIAGAASLTAVAVLAGVMAWTPGTAAGRTHQGPAAPAAVADAAASHTNAAHRAHQNGGSGARSASSTAQAAQSAAGQDVTGALDQQGVEQVGSDTLGATGGIVQDAANAVNKATSDATNTVSTTVNSVTSSAKQVKDATVPGLPGI
jgi:RNA polymerase sigma-70 factor, ECF subfamily